MTTRTRRALGATLLLLVLLLAADTLAWWLATSRLRSAYETWQATLAPTGWQATSAPPAATGWPLAARLRLDHMRLGQSRPPQPTNAESPPANAGFAWTAAEVSFGVSLLHPRTLTVAPEGPQTIAGPGLAPVRFTAAELLAQLPLGAPIRSAQVSATRLVIATPSGDAEVDAAALSADWAEGAAHLHLTAGPATLPAGHNWGLGRSIGAATLDLVAHHAWPSGPPAQAAAQWRDAGGSLDVAAIALRWGALDATGSGHATLDAALQPTASLNLHVASPEAAVSALADAGAITRGAATAAGAVLSLLELPQRLAGRPGVLNLPLALDGGAVTLGQIPIARIPSLSWPAP